jgi:hypothetical protein
MTKKCLLFGLIAITLGVGAMLFLILGSERATVSSPEIGNDTVLKFVPEEIDRIAIKRNRWEHGAYREETTLLKRLADRRWQLTAPVTFPANNNLVHEIVTTLKAIRLVEVAEASESDYKKWQLDDRFGIHVTVYSKDRSSIHLIIGVGRDKVTYVRRAGEAQIYKTSGLIRKVFDRSPNQLRNRKIATFDETAVIRVSYHHDEDTFSMVRATEGGISRYAPEHIEIRNFDSDLAAKRVSSLARLYAKDFYDRPYQATEGASRVSVEVLKDGTPTTVTITLGTTDPQTGLHYLTTSASRQVYLVSSHLKSLFTADAIAFEQTDEQVAARKMWRKLVAEHAEAHERRRQAVLQERHRHFMEEAGSDDNGSGTDPNLENHVE